MKFIKRTLERVEISCPFCGKNTRRWKMFYVNWFRHPLYTQLVPEAVDVKLSNDFEHEVLQEHLNKKECLNNLSSKALSLYNLNG